MKDRDHARRIGGEIYDRLQGLVREVASRHPGGHLIHNDLERITFELDLPLIETDDRRAPFADALVRRVEEYLEDTIQHAATFRPGHAFCHRCGDASCDHSAPPSSRHVFAGYAATGTPRWEEFAQHCLHLRRPEVDRLYADPPILITIQQGADALHNGLLAPFESADYELCGQVIAGWFRVPAPAEEGRAVVALTIQAAASRGASGHRRYGLNVIGVTPWGEPLDTLWDRQDELSWRRAVLWAQSALQTMRGRTTENSTQRIEGILGGLSRRLQRDYRSRGRRTRHAEQRHASGERPTRKAIEDARDAADDAILIDDRRGTVVVLGQRGRTHFFTPDGRLVSSVRYRKDAIARKIKSSLWRPASVVEARALRERLRASEGAGG